MRVWPWGLSIQDNSHSCLTNIVQSAKLTFIIVENEIENMGKTK